MTLGAAPSPHDAWLLMRGLRTLELRVNRSADNAERVANFLEAHPKVKRVNWPFLESHPQHALARKQMKRCAGLMSIRTGRRRRWPVWSASATGCNASYRRELGRLRIPAMAGMCTERAQRLLHRPALHHDPACTSASRMPTC
jgi:hypothetical protein